MNRRRPQAVSSLDSKGEVALLTQNAEMRKDGVWAWSLPAWVVQLSDGRHVNVCPSAGACVKFCYAKAGTFNFPVVKAAHLRNLERVHFDLVGWESDLNKDLTRRRYRATGIPRLPGLSRAHLSDHVAHLLDSGSTCVRIHDSGDFYREQYLSAWLRIAEANPNMLFYSYTKEVSMFKNFVVGKAPDNFLWCFSLGGREDGLVDLHVDRHADVFPDLKSIERAGYQSQHTNDLLCVLSPGHRIGVPANNIRHYKKRLGSRTFGEVELATRRRGSSRDA